MSERCMAHQWVHACEPCPYCENNRKIFGQAPTEMASLMQIKAKLDEVIKRQDYDRESISGWISGIEIAQGKLLAAIDDLAQRVKRKDEMWASCNEEIFKRMDAGLHETAMRNHVQLLEGQKAVDQRLYAVEQFLYANKLLRKARKKARR